MKSPVATPEKRVKKIEENVQEDTDSRHPRAEPVALLKTQALLDARLASSHSPTGKARGTLPFGFLEGLPGGSEEPRTSGQNPQAHYH